MPKRVIDFEAMWASPRPVGASDKLAACAPRGRGACPPTAGLAPPLPADRLEEYLQSFASSQLNARLELAQAENRESEWKEEPPSAPASVLREDG